MGSFWNPFRINNKSSNIIDNSSKKKKKQLEKNLKLCKLKEDSQGEAKCLVEIGFFYFNKHMCSEAADFWKDALRVYQETNNRSSMAESYSNIGTALRLNGELSEAARYYNKAVVLDHEFNSSESELKSLHNLGSTWLDLGEHENALDVFSNAMEQARKMKNKNWEAMSLYKLGLTYQATNQFFEAFRFFEEGLRIAEEVNYLEMLTRCTFGLGQSYELLGEYSEAIFCYEDALSGAKNMDDIDLQMLIRIAQSAFDIHIGNIDRGRQIANELADITNDNLIVSTKLALLRASIYSLYNMSEKEQRMLAQAEKAAEQLLNGYYLANVLLRKAKFETNSGNYEKALAIICQMNGKFAEGKSTYLDLKSLLLVGRIYRGMKKDEQALKTRKAAIIKAQSLFIPKYLWSAHHSLGRFYHHKRQFEEAREHYQIALKWIDRTVSDLDISLRDVFLHQRDRIQIFQDYVILQISTGHKEVAARTLKRLNSSELNQKIQHLFK